MASSSGHRPPVTEGVAEVIVKDIKSGEGRSGASEVPIAFQTGSASRAPADPAALGHARKQMVLFGIFAAVVLAVLLAVWWAA